jgi:hypothetical protein
MSQQRAAGTRDSESVATRIACEGPAPARKDHPITQLQHAIGNRRVQRLIQTGNALDETEAQGAAPFIGNMVNDALNSGGHGLDAETLAFMESGFGWDFSQVRVHTDSSAAESAEAVNAKAYTVGQDIVFGEGEYSPGSSEGLRLLAHELTHVTQQQGMPAVGGDLTISEPSDQPEHEAEQTASDVMSAQEGQPSAEMRSSATGDPGTATVQRDDDDSWLGGLGNMVSNAGSAIASGVGSVVDSGANLVSDAGSAVASGVGSVVNAGESLASDAGSAIASGVGSVVNTGANLVSDTGSAIASGAGSLLNTGESLVSDAGSAIASGVSNAVNTGESLASDAGSAIASGASDVWHAGSAVASDIYGDMQSAGKAVRGATQAVEGGIGDLASMSKEGWNDLADSAKGIPVLEQLASGAAWVGGTAADVTSGVLKGATGLVGSVAGMAADPVDAAIGIENLAEHIPIVPGMPNPLQVAHGLYNVVAKGADIGEEANRVLNPLEVMKGDADFAKNLALGIANPYIDAYHRGNYGEMAGRGIFDVGMLLTGAGEAGAAAEGTEAVSAVGKVAEGSEALGTVAEGTEAASAISEGSEAARAGEGVAEGAEAGPRVPEEGPTPSEPPAGYPDEQWGQPTRPVPPDEHVYEIPSEPTVPDQGPYRTPGTLGGAESAAESVSEGAESTASTKGAPPSDDYDVAAWEKYYQENPGVGRSAGAAANEGSAVAGEAESAAEESLQTTEGATEEAQASEEATTTEESQPANREYEGGRRARSAASREGIAERKEIGAERLRTEQYDPFQDFLEADERDAFIESGGKEVPPGTQMHHTQQTMADPGMADVPEHIQPVTPAEHIPGEHGTNPANVPTAGIRGDVTTPRNPIFDPNAEAAGGATNPGMLSDARRLADSETGARVPSLGETVEDEGNITARPQDQTLEDILNEQAVRNSPEDELIDRIDSSREIEDDFEND